MEYKILNFPEAMKLAKLILKYFQPNEIENLDGKTFGYKLFELLDVDEIMSLSTILLEDAKIIDPRELIYTCVTSMIKNNLLELLNSYKQSGFK